MIQQGAEFTHRDREIRAQKAFAKELEEGTADRRFQKGGAAGMARRVPGIFVETGEVRERREHRRQDAIAVAFDGGKYAPANEVGRILEQPYEVAAVRHGLGGYGRSRAAIG